MDVYILAVANATFSRHFLEIKQAHKNDNSQGNIFPASHKLSTFTLINK